MNSDELEKLLQKLNNPQISLIELKELENEFSEIFSQIKQTVSAKEKKLLDKIIKKCQNIVYEFIDKFRKGEIRPSTEESEFLKKVMKELVDVVYDEVFPEEEKMKAGENLKKVIDWKIGQPRQLSSTAEKPKNDYPWGIIISMGAVIATLLGVIIFLLARKKNKKNE